MTAKNTYHVAEFNWGILIDDWDTETIADFQNNLDRVNAVAERSAGFVWRLNDEDMEAAQLEENGALGGNPRLASTLSVWESAKALDHFVHKTVHGAFLKRSGEWFVKSDGPRHVLWPVACGHKPTITEAAERLRKLGDNGPSSEAFDLNWYRNNAHQMEAAHA